MTQRIRKALSLAPNYIVWIVATVIILLPVYWMFVVSARTRVEAYDKPDLIIRSFYIQNYIDVISNPVYQRYMLNSVIVSTCNAILVAFLALLATYALSRYNLPGSDNIFFWTITNRMAPAAVFLLPLYLLFTKFFVIGDFKLYDTQIGLILLYCVFNLPFAIWLLKGVVDAIPVELDEAAMIDGAGLVGVLRRVILPLAAPGLAITAILSWIFAWNEYLFAATLTSVTARTATTGLAEFITNTGANYGGMAAMATLTLLPSVIFVTLAQRYIITGLTFGAVKE